jgi:colanic acid/amylovoran biosynthesis glycosyltransferase
MGGNHKVIAYIVNQYPKVSHSFIRREILALEEIIGVRIARFALRGWDEILVDPSDIAEREITTYVLRGGAWPLLAAALRQCLSRPRNVLRAARLSLRMMRRTERSVPRHVITLFEACFLAEELAKIGARHIHSHFGTNSAEVAMLTSTLSGIPYSFAVHGPDEFDKPEFNGLREKVSNAKFVAAISFFCASQIYRWVDIDDWRKVKIVRCGVEASFRAAAPTEPKYPNRLVCVGRLSAQKGHILLLEATSRLAREGLVFELVLVGDGEMRAVIESVIREKGLERLVRITGWVSAEGVRDEILAARGLVMTSFAEGLPVVIMETMALGRVVLATQIAGVAELVRHGQTGWLFSAGSVAEAADAIRSCLTAPQERVAEMGEFARRLVAKRHDSSQEAARLLQFIDEGAREACDGSSS